MRTLEGFQTPAVSVFWGETNNPTNNNQSLKLKSANIRTHPLGSSFPHLGTRKFQGSRGGGGLSRI